MLLGILIIIVLLSIVDLKKTNGGGSWSDQYRNSKYGSHKIDGEWVLQPINAMMKMRMLEPSPVMLISL